LGNADTFFTGCGDGVVKPDPLNEPAISAGALVSDHNIEKRASFCSASGESNDDHGISFGMRRVISAFYFST
jgi:hypothetical protein